MGVWVCVSSETVWFSTLIGQNIGSLWRIPRKLTVLRRTRPDATCIAVQVEAFYRTHVKLTLMVRLGMQIAFGRVRRKTAPTGVWVNGAVNAI